MNSQKKRYFLNFEALLVAIALLITPWVVGHLLAAPAAVVKPCAFCSVEVLDRQTLYQGSTVAVLNNYRPLQPGHVLIIPQRHIARFDQLTMEEHEEMRYTINKVQKAFEKVYGTDEYLLSLQNGPKAGQTVPHLHFHMIPRTKSNVITKLKLWGTMLTNTEFLTSSLNDEQLELAYRPLREALEEVE